MEGMTTRTSRRGGGSNKEMTPILSAPPASRARPPSPLSPTRLSRVEEKKQMRNLNDRLACYIEKVRAQNIEIDSLSSEISTIQERRSNEVNTIKNRYDKELAHVRKALDEISKERAKLQIESETLERENKDYKVEVMAKDKMISALEREVKNLSSKNSLLVSEVEAAGRESKLLRPENIKLKAKLEDAKKNLEAETLLRIDAQNKCLSSEEGLRFDNDILQSQLNESKRVKISELSESLEGRYSEEYEAKLQMHLDDLRQTYEAQIKENRREFGAIYDAKIDKLQRLLSEEKSNSAGASAELRELSTKISGFSSRNAELESSTLMLNRRIAELIAEMESAASSYRSDMARKDAELSSKDLQMEDMLNDYKNLMETKVALDMEIAAYSKMIEGEEARLGISFSEDMESPFGRRGIKRKRFLSEEGNQMEEEEEEEEERTEVVSELSGKGRIIIEPLEENLTYIRLRNKTDDEISIGGWKLINVADDVEAVYKFHRSTIISPGSTCTIYSSDVIGVDHTPPFDLVMKSGKWKASDLTITSLFNKEGEDESRRETRRERRRLGTRRRLGGQLYHRGEDDKNCSIM